MSRRPSTLVLRFAVATFVLLASLGVVLGELLAHRIEARARTHAEQTAVLAVKLGVAPRFEPARFGEVLADDERALLDELMARSARNDIGLADDANRALRLKVFNADGTVIYSDLDAIVGETFASPDLRTALGGEVVSKLTHLDDPDEEDDVHFGKALEVYVPLWYGAAEPVGVAELYLPYGPIEQAITRDTRLVYGALAQGLLVFYLATLRMMVRTSRRLVEQAQELRDSAERNDYLAHHDTLTGLPNRVLLGERLEAALASARRCQGVVGVLLIDLDRFKEVNDTLGHETGDVLLRQVGERLIPELRDGDTVARLGGDEFVVLLPDVEGEAAATAVAERLLDALHRPFEVRGLDLAVEASIGVACYPQHGEDAGLLLQHADVAMYVAKQARGTYAVYDASSDESSLDRITLLTELRRALDQGELVLHYQPKAELVDGSVHSVEALLRWQHPTRGLVGPNEFVPLAEQTGLINGLTSYVLDAALRQARAWQDEGRDLSVSVNLSARNLMDSNLPRQVAGLLAECGVDPSRLEVEVTETSAMADPARAVGVLEGLARLGVAVAVDDYGTGYSSLSYLRSLPIGTLKIDRSFVSSMLTDEGNAVIVRSTIELAHNLGLKVVAEGVEDAETYSALVELGCHVAQGYYLGRPAPAESLGAAFGDRAVEATPGRRAAPPALGGGGRAWDVLDGR